MTQDNPTTANKKRRVLGRRRFMQTMAGAAACAGAAATTAVIDGAPALASDKAGGFPAPNYDWTQHRYAFGVDATKCIGCLRCMEACKRENKVPLDAHHFRTWVERYAYLDGEDKPHVDAQSDPGNIAAAASEAVYRFDNRYKDAKLDRAFFVPKLCNQCTNPACVQVCPTGATYKTKDGVVLIDHEYCIGCQYCVQACPFGARFFNYEKNVTDKCTWCYHRVVRKLLPACVQACPMGARIFGDRMDHDSPISAFLRDNRTLVLKPETGNGPNVSYIGIDRGVS